MGTPEGLRWFWMDFYPFGWLRDWDTVCQWKARFGATITPQLKPGIISLTTGKGVRVFTQLPVFHCYTAVHASCS